MRNKIPLIPLTLFVFLLLFTGVAFAETSYVTHNLENGLAFGVPADFQSIALEGEFDLYSGENDLISLNVQSIPTSYDMMEQSYHLMYPDGYFSPVALNELDMLVVEPGAAVETIVTCAVLIDMKDNTCVSFVFSAKTQDGEAAWALINEMIYQIAPASEPSPRHGGHFITPPPTAQPASAPALNVGDWVAFGHYEQDNDTSNGMEAIEWLVLDVQQDRALLLSHYLLDRVLYNDSSSGDSAKWRNSSIRMWLNEDFLNGAFSAEEQAAIVETDVPNESHRNSAWSLHAGADTKDHVFLLSYQEAKTYFPDDESRVTTATAYAEAQGAHYQVWWLRSPGDEYDWHVATIGVSGVIENDMASFCDFLGVRPALWVDLSTLSADSVQVLPQPSVTPTPTPTPAPTPTPKRTPSKPTIFLTSTSTPLPFLNKLFGGLIIPEGGRVSWENSGSKLKVRFQVKNGSTKRTVKAFELYVYATDVWGTELYGDNVYYDTTTRDIEPGDTAYSCYFYLPDRTSIDKIYYGIHRVMYTDGTSEDYTGNVDYFYVEYD